MLEITPFLYVIDFQLNLNNVQMLTRCIPGGRTNAHSQSGSAVDATFAAASPFGSPSSGVVTLRESAVEVAFSGFAGTEGGIKTNP